MTVNTATSGFTVVTNDYPGILAGNPVALSALTITTSGTSANGGIVTMTTSGANVGKFTYAPAPGFTGTDTFTYTISNGVAGTPAGSATGKVTITVAGPVIWFVDRLSAGWRERHLDGHQFEGIPDCGAGDHGDRGSDEPPYLRVEQLWLVDQLRQWRRLELRWMADRPGRDEFAHQHL